jgi:hypothetical protein
MINTILSAVGGVLSYFVGVFGESKLFQPGLGETFVAWKVLFFFIAAGSVFISGSRKGLIAVFVVAILASIALGVNYGSNNAYPPLLSATDTSWFAFQLAQSCFVGIGVRLAAELGKLLPNNGGGSSSGKDAG